MTAEIYRDAWGIPHLRADGVSELARAQGRVTALDRAWQLEVERRRAQGTSAALLGPDSLPWDRFVRRARLDDTARRCWSELERTDPETAAWIRAYVDGVNEGLAGATLPVGAPGGVDAGLAGAAVPVGTPGGVGEGLAEASVPVGVPGGVGGGFGEAAVPVGTTGRVGDGFAEATVPVGAPGGVDAGLAESAPPVGVPGGVGGGLGQAAVPVGTPGGVGEGLAEASVPVADPGRVDEGLAGAAPPVADSGRVGDGLAEAAPPLGARPITPGRWEPWTPLGIWLGIHILFAGFPAKLWREQAVRHLGEEAVGLFAIDGPGTSGSNGWLVSGERTVSGQPIIAGDPHRFIEDAGIYQQIHLSCPEFDVVGLAVPGVPGIAHFGHTGTVAWAITNAMADYQDLYRERLRRTGAGVEALGPDGTWARAARHTETIEVAGEEPVEVEIIETDRGPVVIGGPEGLDDGSDAECAVSLRYPPRVTGDLGFGALLPLLRARRVADVDRAFDRWSEPVNVVQAADTEGGLLHRVAGKVPVRAEANRVRLVPAWEPGHAWQGWHETPYGGLTDGVAVMANQRGPAEPLGVEFAPPHRADRIAALLGQGERWSPGDMAVIHTDTQLASAAPLLDHLAALEGLSPEAARLRGTLLAWNRRMDADSGPAALYAAVRSALVRHLAAHPAFAALTTPPAYPEVLLPWLALVPRIGFALEHLLRAEELYGIDRPEAVRAAVEEVAGRPPRGVWGDTHRLAPWRALPAEYDEPGLSGDHDCVLCTSAVPGVTDLAARGPAARYVWDLDRREHSLWVVPFGASGVPGTPHHRDQLPLWTRGDLIPVVTDFEQLKKESDV